jgi:methylglutaconyl-CoA hydratase
MNYNTLLIEQKDSVVFCKLNRPEVRNAFNAEMIAELTEFARGIGRDVRCVVMQGEGPVFCAGGDLRWMQQSLNMNREQNREDAQRLAQMYFLIDRLPVPVIGLIHGAAFGGGVGLVCVCDYAIAVEETKFSFSEVRLGIVPACISPFVLRKIGPGHARALFTSAERFDARKAYEIGLIHQIVTTQEEGRQNLDKKIVQILECGPEAIRQTKALVFEMLFASGDEQQLDRAADLLAAVRTSEEGQEGLRAFLEKRKPRWTRE